MVLASLDSQASRERLDLQDFQVPLVFPEEVVKKETPASQACQDSQG